MKVSFDQNRCYFGSFTAEDDKDPNTGKSGVRYYKFPVKLWGAIPGFLRLIGVVTKITDSNSKIVYVNRNSLVNWLDRHKKEASNPQEFAGYLKKNAFQKAIEMICKNVQKPSTNSVPVKNPKGRDFGASSVTKNPEVRNEEKRGETLPPAVVYVQDPSDAPFFNRIE